FRVELSEIENYLNTHHAVKEAVVLLQENIRKEQQLFAYFLARENLNPTPIELYSYLKAYFPEYMLPVAFIPVPAFPLNVNGKIDRQALLPPANPLSLSQSYLPPRNKLEKSLVKIWSEVFKISTIGIYDN